MFENKVVIITGGSSGIGKTTALMFAKEKSNLVITYKDNLKGAEEVEKEIENLGSKCLIIKADLTKDSDAKNLIDKTVETFGRMDVLVNNAGRYIDGDEWNSNSDIWLKSLDQNIVSMMRVSKFAVEIFQRQNSGVIVSVSSRYSKDGQYDALSYSVSKAGVVNITQAYAKLLQPFGRANCVSPGPVRVGYWLRAPQEELEAQGKLIEPEEVAEKILYLASDESKDLNGEEIRIGC